MNLPIIEHTTFPSSGTARLANTVLKGNYCIGCGACAAVPNSPVTMVFNDHGLLTARVHTIDNSRCDSESVLRVCPFSNESINENAIAAELFAPHCHHNGSVGYHDTIYAGRVVCSELYAAGSSGGIGRWILVELLQNELIDGVIHVARHTTADASHPLYSYTVAISKEDVLQTAQSAYHPVEMSQALKEIRSRPGRYAITGVPCFIKAVRLLCREDAIFKDRIRYCIGLICGHLKSRRYAEMIGWQLGVPPPELGRLDFRRKFPGRKANEKGVAAYSRTSPSKAQGEDIVQNLYGTQYGLGFFKPNACNYCDDVFAETADVVVGDAWLPQFLDKGTSLVVTRHPDITALIRKGIADNKLDLQPLTCDQAAASQAGGLRDRREGLRYRLYIKQKQGEWHPPKRVSASYRHLTRKYRKIFRLRMDMAERSHSAFQEALDANDFQLFVKRMSPLVAKNRMLYQRLWRRTAKRLLSLVGLLSLVRRFKQ